MSTITARAMKRRNSGSGFIIWVVGWVCILQWVYKFLNNCSKKIENLGKTRGCPKIVLDKR